MNKRKSAQSGQTNSARILLKPVGKLLSQFNNAKNLKRPSFQPGRRRDHFQDEVAPSLHQSYASTRFLKQSSRRIRKQQQQKEFKFNLIQDPRQSEFSYRKYLLIQKILFILTGFSACIVAIGTEMSSLQSSTDQTAVDFGDFPNQHIDMLASVLTLLLIICTLMRYVCLNQLQIDQKKFYYIRYNRGFLAQVYRFFKQKQSVRMFLIQLLIIIPHPFVLFHNTYIVIFQSYEQKYLRHRLNDILALVSLLRAYIVVRSIINLSIYSTPRAARLCAHNRVNHSILYTVKCLLRERPVKIITLIFIVQLITLGFGLKLSQGSISYYNHPQISATGFQNYINCYWCVFITMATVGYGDYYPKTILGRIMAILAAISGIILSSSLIVSMSAYLTMQANETKSHLTLARLQHQKLLKQEATQALIETMKMTKYLSSQQKQNDYKIKDIFTTIKHKIDLVKYRTRKIKSMVNNNNIMQQMNRLFQLFKDNLQQSFRNQLMLKQNLDSLNKVPNMERKMKTMFLTHNMDQIMGKKN